MEKISFMKWLVVALLLTGCQKPKLGDDFVQLIDWMQGSFSSQAQSQQHSDYFDIRLHMVKIWPQRKDGYWLYVEQAAADYLDKPYRQRIYHVYKHSEEPLRYASAVYEIESAQTFVGAYDDPQLFGQLQPQDLIERTGCTVILELQLDGSYFGSTPGKACLSDHQGATYATSIVRIDSDSIESWDQGFNAQDEQVWGAVKGPYIFVR
ncbi:chromophore lyase CpcT/CpeT [Marinicella sp. W31]|uniref:chromophore lyase CpcT/CpeT n=1 Tax=Marinicella sp. W31 TaxID=3023713 RepID=UPI0037575EB6